MATKKTVNLPWSGIPYREYFYIWVGLCVAIAASLIILKNYLPPIVPLLYGRPVGAGQLVPLLGLLVAPGVALLITVLNVFLSIVIKDEFIQKILILSAFLLTVLVLITFVKIVLLIGFF